MPTKRKSLHIRAIILFVVTVGVLACNMPTKTTISTPTVAWERFSPPHYGRVITTGTIVRASADVSSPETARLPAGATVEVVARQGDWVQIQSPDVPSGTGWVLARFLDISESPTPPDTSETPEPTLLPPATPSPTPTPLPTLTLLPPPTSMPTPTPAPTLLPPPSPTPTPGITASPTSRPTPLPPPTPTPTPTSAAPPPTATPTPAAPLPTYTPAAP